MLWNAGIMWQQKGTRTQFHLPHDFLMLCLHKHMLVPYRQIWYPILCTERLSAALHCKLHFISSLTIQKYGSSWLFAVHVIFWHGCIFSLKFWKIKEQKNKPNQQQQQQEQQQQIKHKTKQTNKQKKKSPTQKNPTNKKINTKKNKIIMHKNMKIIW